MSSSPSIVVLVDKTGCGAFVRKEIGLTGCIGIPCKCTSKSSHEEVNHEKTARAEGGGQTPAEEVATVTQRADAERLVMPLVLFQPGPVANATLPELTGTGEMVDWSRADTVTNGVVW